MKKKLPFESSLTRAIEALDRKNALNFSTGDLRICIGQQHRLEEFVPVTISLLQANPLVEGDLYPGDLLSAVLRLNGEYWQKHPAHKAAVTDIVKQVRCNEDELSHDLMQQFDTWLNS